MTDGQQWYSDQDHSTTPAQQYTKPTVSVVGVFRGGKVVRVEWSETENHVSLSDRTLSALEQLGVVIIDKPDNYLFKGEVI